MLTANGEYYVFLAPDGALTDGALSALRTAARTGADFIYGDELTIAADGTERPCRKPGPSPDTLLSYNYIGSPMAVSSALMERAGPPANERYAERWAFAMRAFFDAEFVLRIPRILYRGRQERREADLQIVQTQLKRLQRTGEAFAARAEGCVSVRYCCPPQTLLSVVIAVEARPERLRDTLDSLVLWNTETRIEYIVVEGGAPSEHAEPYYRALEKHGVKLLRNWYEPNFARQYNLAAAEANGDALLFLRAGDRVGNMDALLYMLEFAIQPHIGAVCACMEKPRKERAYVRNVRFIPHAPMLARDTLIKVGGFDESLSAEGCEAALSLNLRERRLQLVRTPDAVIELAPRRARRDERTAQRCRDLSI